MKIFKNKFFIITLSVAVFFSIFTATLSVMGQSNPIKQILESVATPFRFVSVKINQSIDGFTQYFQSIDELIQKNQELESKVEELEGIISDAEATKNENQRLREYLEIKKTYPDFEMLDALIIGRESSSSNTFLTLDRGSGDGVKIGMPIVITNGVVGSVCDVGYSTCTVRVLNESSSGVGAYVERSGEVGIVGGDISFKGSNLCILSYLDENADIQEGDYVYTSGLGENFPRNLLIGKVKSVSLDEYLRKKTAILECAVDFEKLKFVMIITDFEIVTESETENLQSGVK